MSGRTWTCKPCNVTILLAYDQLAHLYSESHIRNTTKPPAQKPPKKPTPKFWTCEICNIIITANQIEVHESGKRHKREQKKNKTTSQIQKPTTTTTTTSTHEEIGQTWTTCLSCNITVSSGLWGSHELSPEHQKMKKMKSLLPRTLKKTTPKKARKLQEELFTCKDCDITFPKSYEEIHRVGNLHKRIIQDLWYCNTCDVVIPEYTQGSHKDCEQHQEGLKQETRNTISRQKPGKPNYTPYLCVGLIFGTNWLVALRKLSGFGAFTPLDESITREPEITPRRPPKRITPTQPPTTTIQRPPKALERERLIKIYFETMPEWWTCPDCKFTMYAESQETHDCNNCRLPPKIKLEPREGVSFMSVRRPITSELQKSYDAGVRAVQKERDLERGAFRDIKSLRMRRVDCVKEIPVLKLRAKGYRNNQKRPKKRSGKKAQKSGC